MPTTIYHTDNRTRLQVAVREAAEWSEFTYRDDPDYNAFCLAIIEEIENQEIQRPGRNGPELDAVRHNTLFGAWYVAKTFRNHWQRPTSRSENDMLWVLYHRGWTRNQAIVAVIAWWRVHRRSITETMLLNLERLADKVWKQIQREKMTKKHEAQQNSLRNRIIWFLQQQPATTAFMATKLNATSKAVDSHLYRLRKEGIVERQSWGLYALAGAAPLDAKANPATATDDRRRPTTVPTTGHDAPARTDSWTLDDIEDGVAEPTGMPSASYRDAHAVEADDFKWADLEMPTAAPSNLLTAEPNWSRL